MITKEYIAGFIDGEGCIDIRYRRINGGRYQRFEMRVCISQVVGLPLYLIASMYGGSVAKHGKIHRYVVTSKQAYALLSDIRPYLIVKADEARIAMEFYELVLSGKTDRYIKGKRYIQKESVAITDKKIICFHAIRQARREKGIKPQIRKALWNL